MEQLPKKYHRTVINALSSDSLKISFSKTSNIIKTTANPLSMTLKSAFNKKLKGKYPHINIHLVDDHQGWFHWWRWDSWVEQLNYYFYKDSMLIKRQHEFSVSVRLSNNVWLNIENFITPTSFIQAIPTITSTLFTTLLLVIITLVMINFIINPFYKLADSANRFGRGLTETKVIIRGPQDIHNALESFNLMQDRINCFVKDRTQLLAAISHDLRTPITSLRLRCEFIEDNRLKTKFIETLDEMQSITESTLMFSTNDIGNEKSCKVNVYLLLEAVVNDYKDMNKNVSLTGEKDIIMNCRPVSLKRAVNNVVDNAVKFAEVSEVVLSTSRQHIMIEIIDNGPGIAEADLDKVFDPFFKIDQSRSSAGSGLGLSISRSIIIAHGGSIFLGNQSGEG